MAEGTASADVYAKSDLDTWLGRLETVADYLHCNTTKAQTLQILHPKR